MNRGEAGSTLVEVMVGCLILMVIVVAGMEYLSQTQTVVIRQKNRQLAIAATQSRLEEVRATSYAGLTNGLSLNYSTNWMGRIAGAWVKNTTNAISIGGQSMLLLTAFQYFDAADDANSYDGLRVIVSVGYRQGTTDQVTLGTRVAP